MASLDLYVSALHIPSALFLNGFSCLCQTLTPFVLFPTIWLHLLLAYLNNASNNYEDSSLGILVERAAYVHECAEGVRGEIKPGDQGAKNRSRRQLEGTLFSEMGLLTGVDSCRRTVR